MNLIAGIFVLSLSILIHELGHLLFGRLVGIRARVFSFGYGKGILKKTIGDTTYQITAIPLGGYVQFYGDDITQRDQAKPGDFFYVGPLKRIIPVIGGPLMNLVLGLIIFAFFNFVGSEKPSSRIFVPRETAIPDKQTGLMKKIESPAYKAGLRNGDKIVEINGKKISTYADMKAAVIFNSSKMMDVTFIRDGKERTVKVESIIPNEGDFPIIGVQPYFYFGIQKIIPSGPAFHSGFLEKDIIVSIDGIVHNSLEEMIRYLQQKQIGKVKIEIERSGKRLTRELILESKNKIIFQNPVLSSVPGFSLDNQSIIYSDSLASAINKKIIKINGNIVANEADLQKIIQANRGKKVSIETGAGQYTVVLSSEKINFAGISFQIAKVDSEMVKYGIMASIGMAFIDAWDFVILNLKGIKKLFSGELSVQENLSGPIRIAKMAGDVAEHGWGPLFLFLAQISVVLMIMNLLPIPVVDGGHILFFLVEAAMGKPLNQKLQEKIMGFGVFFLISLGVYVIFNDILSLEFIKNIIHLFG